CSQPDYAAGSSPFPISPTSGETSMPSARIPVCSAFAVILSSATLLLADEPRMELLWPQGAPGAVGSEDGDKPTLAIWQPSADKSVGCAVVVCPGGGYGHLAVDHEGKQIAEWLNSLGVTAFMLKY